MNKILLAYLLSAFFIFLGLYWLREAFRKKSFSEKVKDIHYPPLKNSDQPIVLISFGIFFIVVGLILVYIVSARP
ncbi:MAG: hypothetical protein JWQ27_392 [Ferruginibacter sp.]|nr:hypothetical protein [Ferruginibacter sp.]